MDMKAFSDGLRDAGLAIPAAVIGTHSAEDEIMSAVMLIGCWASSGKASTLRNAARRLEAAAAAMEAKPECEHCGATDGLRVLRDSITPGGNPALTCAGCFSGDIEPELCGGAQVAPCFDDLELADVPPLPAGRTLGAVGRR